MARWFRFWFLQSVPSHVDKNRSEQIEIGCAAWSELLRIVCRISPVEKDFGPGQSVGIELVGSAKLNSGIVGIGKAIEGVQNGFDNVVRVRFSAIIETVQKAFLPVLRDVFGQREVSIDGAEDGRVGRRGFGFGLIPDSLDQRLKFAGFRRRVDAVFCDSRPAFTHRLSGDYETDFHDKTLLKRMRIVVMKIQKIVYSLDSKIGGWYRFHRGGFWQ